MSEILATQMITLAATTPEMASERIGKLFDRYHHRLYCLARRLTSDAEEARDMVQETFLRAARKPRSLPASDDRAEAWLVRVVVNLCRDRYRRLAVRRRPGLEEKLARPEPSTPESQVVARLSVQAALAELEPRRRAVVVLRELEGLAVADVARLLSMNAGTVRWHHSLGRKELARHLEVPLETPNKVGSADKEVSHE